MFCFVVHNIYNICTICISSQGFPREKLFSSHGLSEIVEVISLEKCKSQPAGCQGGLHLPGLSLSLNSINHRQRDLRANSIRSKYYKCCDWFSPEEPRLAWLPLPHSLSQQAEEDHSPEAPRLALALQRSSQPLYLHVYPQTPCKQVLPFCTLQNISAPEEMPDLSLQERSVIAQPAIELKCPLITSLRQRNVRSSPEGRHRL